MWLANRLTGPRDKYWTLAGFESLPGHDELGFPSGEALFLCVKGAGVSQPLVLSCCYILFFLCRGWCCRGGSSCFRCTRQDRSYGGAVHTYHRYDDNRLHKYLQNKY